MVVVSAIRIVLGAIQYPINMIKEDKQLSIQLKIGLRSIKDDLETITKKVEEYDELRLHELAYDIEDFTEGLWVPRGALGPVLSAIGANPKDEHVQVINDFKERIQNLVKCQQKGPELGSSGASSSTSGAAGSPYYTPKEDLVGINADDKPMKELLELLSPLPAEDKQLRVISIVGCTGVGKTALARAVYDYCRADASYDCVAWVVATECSHAGEILNKVLEAVGNKAGDEAIASTLLLHDILEHKRYLVFIDGVQRAPADVWVDTVDAFPNNSKSSRIIVTTNVHSIAAACSSGSYVYKMQCLGEADSNNLFWTRVYGCDRKPADALVNGSKGIFRKCDGLPLALISVAKYLRTKGGLRKEYLESVDCETAGQTVSAFGKMRGGLVQCYDSLPDCNQETCLLYLSIFPRGHMIKSKSLLRRLTAEGLGAQDSEKCFQELVDRCFVEPVQSCSNSRDVKRCQVHGVMLEYIIEQAVSKNMVTLIHEAENLHTVDSNRAARVRRLSIQTCSQKEYCGIEDKSAIRSLTLFNGGRFEFTSCKMLRLLDLEGCKDLNNDKSLASICELQLLRYLSLRKTDVRELPRNIEKLERLVTLDVRETDSPLALSLPIEVIMLPKLANLFGKFKLTGVPRDTKELKEFLSCRSQLHTLAGLHINDQQDHIMLDAINLKKVKIWYDPAPPAPNNASVPDPISTSSVISPTLSHPAPSRALSSPVQCSTADPTISPAPAPAPAPNNRYSFGNWLCCFSRGKNPVPSAGPTLDDHQNSEITASTSTSIRAPDHVPSGPSTIDYLISSLRARSYDLESVSIVSNQLSGDFLVFVLSGHCTISSVRLNGRLQSLPQFSILKQKEPHSNFKRLQLISTGLSSEDLSALQSLSCLEYLKLSEDPYGFLGSNFIVHRGGFQSLKRLCFQAPKLPKLQFHEGAMTSLVSLQLLCPDSSQLQMTAQTIETISHAANLNEVVLHHSATEGAQDHWKTAIQNHPNRPCVKKQPQSKASTEA